MPNPTQPTNDHQDHFATPSAMVDDESALECETVLTLALPAQITKPVRLDKALSELLGESYSREYLKKLIQDGCVHVNDILQQRPATPVNAGDQLTVQIPEIEALDFIPENIPLDIVFEDAHLLVVHKPKGMMTHPSGMQRTGTLVNALLHHCAGELSGINGVERPGIVHRLDMDTSGLLLVAKTDTAHRLLSEAIQQRTIHREYRAVVHGVPEDGHGTISAPIGRDKKQRQRMCIDPTGRQAVTHWRRVNLLAPRFCLLELKLDTGRTHQIRVHLRHKGWPIVGDPYYGDGVEKSLHLKTQGQLLQAFRLRFTHPVTGKAHRYELPLTAEMQAVCEQLSGYPL